VGVVCSNAYGAKNWKIFYKNSHSWTKLLIIESLFSFLILVIFPYPLIAFVAPHNTPQAIFPLIRSMLFFMWLLLFTVGCSVSLRMTLTALGDTTFILWGNVILYASCSIFPSYLALRYGNSILLAAASWVLYNCIFSVACFIRSRRVLMSLQ
jgi:Na+-driven multidrug efflux pump